MSRAGQYRASSNTLAVKKRSAFIVLTYLHLAGAIAAFIGLEAYLLSLPWIEEWVWKLLGLSKYSWLVVLALFMIVSGIAESWAYSRAGKLVQYMGLALYVAAEAVIFIPLLYIARNYYPEVIPDAVQATVALFSILSLAVLITRKNLSFMRTGLVFAGLIALGYIVAGTVFEFPFGNIFVYAMIIFACLCILYETSNLLHNCGTDQYVGASLALFASIALLFWYILQLFMGRR